MSNGKHVQLVVNRTIGKIHQWGISATFLSGQLGVSRQYIWQILHHQASLSLDRALEVERTVDAIIADGRHVATFGDRLRAARKSAGFTLKQVAEHLGYTWIGVERWEKNLCVPKPAVLSQLLDLYGAGISRARHRTPPPLLHNLSAELLGLHRPRS